MVKITRLLEYEFPDMDVAVKSLDNRAVKGAQVWGRCRITEKFYCESHEACSVLGKMAPLVIQGEAPDGRT